MPLVQGFAWPAVSRLFKNMGQQTFQDKHPASLHRHLGRQQSARMMVLTSRVLTQGWSPERSQRFGHAFLNAVLAVLPDLR